MLAIAGGKGGCGKTTTTLGLARALDGAVLAVDADVDMPNLGAMAGLLVESRSQGGEGGETPPPNPRESASAGATTATAAGTVEGRPDPTGADVRLVGPPPDTDPTRVARWLRRVGRDRTLVDCPAGAGPDAVAPLRVADGVLLVSSLCGPSLRDTAKTAAMARAVGTPPVGVVLTRTGHAPEAVADLLGCRVLGTVPRSPEPLESRPVRTEYRAIGGSLLQGEVL